MHPQVAQTAPHSAAWVAFTYASFAGSVIMVALAIIFLPLDIWIKGYFAIGMAMLVQSSITVTKTLRDQHEGAKLVNRIEDAKTERLLMGIERSAE
jgi:hypothetical protein